MTTPKEARGTLEVLEQLARHLERQRDEYLSLPEDHPQRDKLRYSHDWNMQRIPALRTACVSIGFDIRAAHEEAQASELLCQLVAALRAGHAARNIEAKLQAQALLEEAFGKAATHVDDWGTR